MTSRYEPPYFYILLVVILANAIFSTYFIAILLSGVVFKIFQITLKTEQYYLFVFTLFTFLNIENIQGFSFFSLTIISLLLHYIIIPKIKHLITSSGLKEVIYLLLFYFGYFISSHIVFNLELLKIILMNFFLDITIIGFVL